MIGSVTSTDGLTRVKPPRKDPVLKKMYFSLDGPEGPSKDFQRYAYQLLHNKLVSLIHYLGVEKVAVDFVHGNAKNNTEKKYVRTCLSYLNTCKSLVTTDIASKVYKKEIAATCDPDSALVCAPRNMKQLRNLRFQHLQQTRISHDTLFNMHEIAYDIPGFVWRITTFPDLLCICGLKEVLSEFDRVLLLKSHFQLVS